MGQGNSQPGGQHVFEADKPVRMSQQLIESLQSSPEGFLDETSQRMLNQKSSDHEANGATQTDGTRAKDIELHIQKRVQQELKKLESEGAKALKELEKKLADEPVDGAIGAPATGPTSGKPDLGRESVQKDITSLREKLEQRKLREDVVNDKAVEGAKSAVVSCLKENSKRPLDCWQEVENFKREVARLETGFLERHI